MLLRMTNDEISRHWPEISEAVAFCLPPFTYGDPERMNNLLKSALTGQAQAWKVLGQRPAEGGIEVVLLGILVTCFDFDAVSGVRNLMIYALYGVLPLADDIYRAGLDVLRRFARDNGCHRIVALTAEPRLIELAKSIGGKADYTFVSLEV